MPLFKFSKIFFQSILFPKTWGNLSQLLPIEYGGADRNRTGDLRRAKPALSQLSYSPKNFSKGKIFDRDYRKSFLFTDSPVLSVCSAQIFK